MRYQEFSAQCWEVDSLNSEVAHKEYEQRREQGQSAVIGVIGVGEDNSGVCREFWSEVRARIEERDEIGPYFFGDENAVRGLALWRSVQESWYTS